MRGIGADLPHSHSKATMIAVKPQCSETKLGFNHNHTVRQFMQKSLDDGFLIGIKTKDQ